MMLNYISEENYINDALLAVPRDPQNSRYLAFVNAT